MERLIRVSTGVTEFAPGWKARITPIKPFDSITPGRTAYHEAAHAVAGIDDLVEASNVPGPGYNGITKLSRFNPIAFMAAHAMGCDGTGHDVAVTAMMGHDPESVASAARSHLAPLAEEIHAVASLIETRRTISGYEARMAMDMVANPKVQIEIIDPKGKTGQFAEKIKKGQEYLKTTIQITNLTKNRLAA